MIDIENNILNLNKKLKKVNILNPFLLYNKSKFNYKIVCSNSIQRNDNLILKSFKIKLKNKRIL